MLGKERLTLTEECPCCYNGKSNPEPVDDTTEQSNEFVAEQGWE
jgi:hypothetical protein